MRVLTSLPVLALLGACAPGYEARQILPDHRLLVQQSQDSTAQLRVVGDPSGYAALTRNLVIQQNVHVGLVLALVDAITDFPPTWANEDQTEVLWGPWLSDGVHGQLGVIEEADGHYVWSIGMRPEDSGDDDWVTVLVGEVDAGATAVTSTGRFAFDFDAAASIGEGGGTTGTLAVDYALRESGATTSVFLGEFAEADAIPADAATHFDWDEGRGGTMDVVVEQDLSSPPNGTDEITIIQSQWNESNAGRADAFLTGGDFGGLTFTERECWTSLGSVVYFQNNFTLEQNGSEADCVFGPPAALGDEE